MGNGYSKQVNSTVLSNARDVATRHGIYTGRHRKDRYDLSRESDLGSMYKCSFEDKGIVRDNAPKDAKHIASPTSQPQGPFFNCSKEDSDGLRITAAFSLNYSAYYNCPNSARKVPHAPSADEAEVPSVLQNDTSSELLPGGFTAEEKERCRSSAEPAVTLQDATANKHILRCPNGESHTACSNKNESYVRSGSRNPTSSSISNCKSSDIGPVKNTKDTRNHAAYLLWSYKPHDRVLGDTTIPTFPVLSYGDQFPFYKSTMSSKRTGGPALEQNNVKNPKIPRYHKSSLDSGNRYYEVSHIKQTRKELVSRDEPLDTHRAAEWVRPGDFEESITGPFDCVLFEESEILTRSADSQTSYHNSPLTRASLFSDDPEDGILRDMSCRGMPSSLSIGYPTKDVATLRRERSSIKLRTTNVKDSCQAQNDDFGFSGSLDPNEQPRTAEEFIHDPLPNNLDDQLSKTPPFSKASSAPKRPSRVAGVEPTRISKPPQVPNLDNGSFHHRSASYNQHWTSKVPHPQNAATSMIREPGEQKEGDGLKQRRTLGKPGEFHESDVAKFRTSQTYVDHVKKPIATPTSVARSEARKSEMKPTNRSSDEIVRDPRMHLQPPGNTANHEGASESFSFSTRKECHVNKMEVKESREHVPSKDSAPCAVKTDDLIHQTNRKGRFNWDSFTVSLQRKIWTKSLSEEDAEEERSRTSNERSFVPKDIAPKKVAQDPLTKSSHTLTCVTEDNPSIICKSTDSTSNADSSYGADASIEGLVSYEKSDDNGSVIPIQETTEGLEVSRKPTCDICGKTFTRNNTLLSHKHIHSGAKPYSCEHCGRAFRQQGNLTRHMTIHINVKSYTCSYCKKTFSRASNLHTHLRTHTNYRPFDCNICGKGFHQKIDMKVHRYTHTGEKPHICSICGKGFKQLTHLKYHLRIHSDVRMFICEYCGKGFNQKGNLQAHINGHTGNRPHKCDTCGKGFTLASTLNTHKRTHALTKPFQCTLCDKSYYQKSALKTHYIASHPFTSGYCDRM